MLTANLTMSSNASHALAYMHAEEVPEAEIRVLLGTNTLGGKRYASLYILATLPHGGSMEQTLPLKTPPGDCKAALRALVKSESFNQSMLDGLLKLQGTSHS